MFINLSLVNKVVISREQKYDFRKGKEFFGTRDIDRLYCASFSLNLLAKKYCIFKIFRKTHTVLISSWNQAWISCRVEQKKTKMRHTFIKSPELYFAWCGDRFIVTTIEVHLSK